MMRRATPYGAGGGQRMGMKGGGNMGGGNTGGNSGKFAMKILLAGKEASAVLGPGGSISKDIGMQTTTRLRMSNKNEFFPGTQLQELCVRGPGVMQATSAVFLVLAKIYEDSNKIAGGDLDVEDGVCRIRLVVPVAAAKAIIGKGGNNIKFLRENTGLRVHIDEVSIGWGELAEQVVIIQGQIDAVQAGLPNIVEKVAEFMEFPWFQEWINSSNAGQEAVAVTHQSNKGGQMQSMQTMTSMAGTVGKGSHVGGNAGKGGGKKGGKRQQNLMQPTSMQHQQYQPEESAPLGYNDQIAISDQGHGAQESAGCGQEDFDMIAGALNSLPPSVVDRSNISQTLNFNCPASCVSKLIGKAGAGTKEITAQTGAKIMIRDIEGNEMEKNVTVTGFATGVCAAYLHLTARISTLIQQGEGWIGGELDGQIQG